MSLIECPACKNRSIEYDPRCRSFICLMDDCRSSWSPEPNNKAELTALRNQVRLLMDKAELADMYEKWLLEIGRVVGCQHLDEQLPNCVTAAFHGYRDADELESLRYEARWIRAKLNLPEDCELLSGETTLAGTMHVLCSDAYGFREYIKSHKCDDKQGIPRSVSQQDGQRGTIVLGHRGTGTNCIGGCPMSSRDEWYQLDEVEEWLKRDYPPLATHWVEFIYKHLNSAFNKGQQIGRGETENKVINLKIDNEELLAHLQTAVKWMEFWLTEDCCECDVYGHTCGKRERKNELDGMRAAIDKALGEPNVKPE